MPSDPVVPVVDLFAGPGGLGEGFSSFRTARGGHRYRVVLSIEKEQYAHSTLLLRSFFRQFRARATPKEYYGYLRGEMSRDQLFEQYQEEASRAEEEAWCAELGVVDTTEVDRRIRRVLSGKRTWILLGGPPCQAYSMVGRSRMAKAWTEAPERKLNDRRHFLYRAYLRIIGEHRPPVFLMENVPGLLSSRVGGEALFEQVLADMAQPLGGSRPGNRTREELKYRILSVVAKPRGWTLDGRPILRPRDFVIRCEEYGIPQTRHRVILLGVRADLEGDPSILQRYDARTSVDDVITGLPALRSCLSRTADSATAWREALESFKPESWLLDDPAVREEVQRQLRGLHDGMGVGAEYVPSPKPCRPGFRPRWFVDRRLGGVCNHTARSHMVSDLHRYLFAACYARVTGTSPKLRDFPGFLLPRHRSAQEGVRRGKFDDRFRVQVAGLPATTITSHLSKDGHYYIHPDPKQCRSLTVREAARLQTFPDNYRLEGPRTAQYVQVGNAVPPLLAWMLAGQVSELLRRAGQV